MYKNEERAKRNASILRPLHEYRGFLYIIYGFLEIDDEGIGGGPGASTLGRHVHAIWLRGKRFQDRKHYNKGQRRDVSWMRLGHKSWSGEDHLRGGVSCWRCMTVLCTMHMWVVPNFRRVIDTYGTGKNPIQLPSLLYLK